MAAGREHGSVLAGALWMIVLGILLFWLPAIGPFVAGFVGGRVAGSVGGALLAALLPALIVAAAVFVVSIFLLVPFFGLVTAGGIVVGMAISSIPLLIGAAIGGATAT
ncbi:MAG: hypothetical protein M0Z94_03080 [Dehalococcoidales bacterium]|nr:hypothetical protein [Dehalococcoidales bacterium]